MARDDRMGKGKCGEDALTATIPCTKEIDMKGKSRQPLPYAPSPVDDGVQYRSSETRRDNNNKDCDIYLPAVSTGADVHVDPSEFANSSCGIDSGDKRTPKYKALNDLNSPPVQDIEFKCSATNEQDLSASPADPRRYRELKQQLRERRRELVAERRVIKQKIKGIDRAFESLRTGQIGQAVQLLHYRRETDVQSTASTEGSTPPTSPTRSADGSIVPKEGKTNDAKSKVTEIRKEVKNLEWTVASSSRRNGLYTGTALNGKIPHGTGTLLFTNSDIYEGPFKYGTMQGSNGVLKSVSGSKYEGEFLRNLKHGTGEEIFENGGRYVGKYEMGLPHGFGVQYNEDGTVFYLGQWDEGKPVRKCASEPEYEIQVEIDLLSNSDDLEVSNLDVTEEQVSLYVDSSPRPGVVLKSSTAPTWVWSSNMNDADIPLAFDILSEDDKSSMCSSDSSDEGNASKYNQV